MYGTRVYPTAIQLVTTVKDTLEYYIYLEFSDFGQCVEDIRTECLTHSKIAVQVQARHTYVLANLKRLENEMRKSIGELKNDAIELRRKANDKRERSTVMKLAGAIAGVTAAVDGGMALAAVAAIGGAYMGGQLSDSASNAERRSITAMQNAAMLHQLIESLEGLVEAVDLVASFVAILADELKGISKIGVGVEFKVMHWKKMTGKASTLVDSCKAFIAVEPAIRSDLLSIKEKLDDRYVQKWGQDFHEHNARLKLEI
jgi:hypothetical protein